MRQVILFEHKCCDEQMSLDSLFKLSIQLDQLQQNCRGKLKKVNLATDGCKTVKPIFPQWNSKSTKGRDYLITVAGSDTKLPTVPLAKHQVCHKLCITEPTLLACYSKVRSVHYF